MTQNEQADDLRLRAARSAYVAFAVMFSVPAAVCVVAAIKVRPIWAGVAILVALLACVLVCLYRLEIVVSEGTISYQTLLGRSSLPLTDIGESEFRWRRAGRRAHPCLVIKPVEGGRPLIINLKYFRREDIARLVDMSELRLQQWDDVE